MGKSQIVRAFFYVHFQVLSAAVLVATFLFNFNVLALGKECEKSLSVKSAVSKLSIRESILEVAEEIRALRPRSGAEATPEWKKNALLKSEGVRQTMMNMEVTLREAIAGEKSTAKQKMAVKASARVLADFIQELLLKFDADGIRYHWYLKISYFYSLQIDMFWSEDIESYHRSILVSSENLSDGFRPQFDSSEQILGLFARERFFLHRSRSHQVLDFQLYGHYDNSNPLIYVPTFANLGFESLLWFQSRGIGVLGLTSRPQSVDGETLLPLTFFIHDFLHAKYIFRTTDPSDKQLTYDDIGAMAEFYDSLITRVGKASASARDRLIKVSLLFIVYHEGVAEEFNSIAPSLMGYGCKTGLARFLKSENSLYSFFSATERSRARLKDHENDLGIAFKNQPPTDDEIRGGILSLHDILKRACRKR